MDLKKIMETHNIEIKGFSDVENEFDLFFANTDLKKEDRIWLLEIIEKLSNNLSKQ